MDKADRARHSASCEGGSLRGDLPDRVGARPEPGSNGQPVRVLAVFGTRPEAIKLAPVIRELRRRSTRVFVKVCVTAQHREMLDQVMQLFEIVPDYDLDVMQDSQSPTQVAAAVMAGIEPVLEAEKPDWVLVQGDTTTVAAAAWAAFHAGARVGHVEAGLRTFDKRRPFPEEVNRRLAGVLADLHLAPTEQSRLNLLNEGVSGDCIVVTGNPVIDALHWAADMPLPASVLGLLLPAADEERRLIVVTAHRRENFGGPLERICLALRDVAQRHEGRVVIVYPVHLNPSVQEPVNRLLAGVSGVILTDPLDYLAMVHLMKRAYLVLTDSGGIQEEAPGLGKPVLVLRDVTERPEAVDAGTVRLVGTARERIVGEVELLLGDAAAYSRMARAVNPYGDGRAAERIAGALLGEEVTPFLPGGQVVANAEGGGGLAARAGAGG